MTSLVDIQALRQASGSRWTDLLPRLTGIDPQLLDGKNHPCPKCGGTDRFRMIDKEDGALFCNQCFNKHNGDGIAAVMWLTGLSFPEAVQRISAELGLAARPADQDVIAEMAWRKGTSAAVLRQFGAEEAMRGELKVCRIPMYDADMNRIGEFDMSPISEEMSKGKSVRGSKLGLFATGKPEPGQTLMVVEGVKDASALIACGKSAVGLPTCRMDAGLARFFRDCHVVIIPDRDKAGQDGAEQTAARLFGVAASVRIAQLPAEFKETGGADVRDVLRSKDGGIKLEDAIAHAPLWTPSAGRKSPTIALLADACRTFLLAEDQRDSLLRTGLPDLDDALGGGVLPGEMVIVAGRPSHGKTVVGMQALDNLALNVPCLMISEEMSIQALARRALCGIAGTQNPQWESHKDSLLEPCARHFAGRKIFIAEGCGTIERVIQVIDTAKRDHNIGAVAVDYVQLLQGRGQSRYEQVSDVSTRLKQVAIRNDLVLIAICQLNREAEKRGSDKSRRDNHQTSTPRMSDLRDSGQLEQDADIIVFVEWKWRSDPEVFTKTEYRMMVGKNRNRPIVRSIIECVFMPDQQRLCPRAAPQYHDEFTQFSGRDRAAGF